MRPYEGHIQESSASRLIHGLALYNVTRENFSEDLGSYIHVLIPLIHSHGQIRVCVCGHPCISKLVRHLSLVTVISRDDEKPACWLGSCLELNFVGFNDLFRHDHSVHSHQRH